jgi:tetratricopeptide (TPR) repeat protein
MSRFKTVVLLPLSLAGMMAYGQQGGDFEAQILYAFHTEDTNELASVAELLSTQQQAGGADATLRYHLAHAEYRLGLLAGEKRPRNAESAFSECVDELKPNLAQDAAAVESLALQAACYASLALYEKVERALLRSRAEDRLNSAYKLAPRNPRVLYLTAMDGLGHSKPGSQENQLAFGRLQVAAALFEQSSATSVDVPGWGHAEAYLELGRQLEARGDVLGARNWIEKSLIIAPDFKAAQRQLAALLRR